MSLFQLGRCGKPGVLGSEVEELPAVVSWWLSFAHGRSEHNASHSSRSFRIWASDGIAARDGELSSIYLGAHIPHTGSPLPGSRRSCCNKNDLRTWASDGNTGPGVLSASTEKGRMKALTSQVLTRTVVDAIVDGVQEKIDGCTSVGETEKVR